MANQSENKFFGITIKQTEKKFVVPYKKTMNLVHEDVTVNWTKVAIIALVVVAFGAVGVKFGFIDPLGAKRDAELTLSTKQMQYATLNVKMSEYSHVEALYGRYSYGWMSDSEASMLQKEKVLEILENKIASACVIESFSVSSNTMTLSISNVTLEEAREIVKQLNDDPNVRSATVYSAVSTDEDHNAKISMSVIFQKEETK